MKMNKYTRWEILSWAVSAEAFGWVVAKHYVGDDEPDRWYTPQVFMYDGSEDYVGKNVMTYKRARVNARGIENDTIEEFEVTDK